MSDAPVPFWDFVRERTAAREDAGELEKKLEESEPRFIYGTSGSPDYLREGVGENRYWKVKR